MIVPMKKATILFRTRDAEATVKCLRKLGLLHVEHQNPPEGRDISELQEKVALIDSSFDVLNRATASEKNIQPQNNITGDWTAVADHIIELGHQLEQREASSGNIISQINEWEHWGDVDISQIQHLNQNGIYLALYEVPVKEIRSFPDDVIVKTIFTTGDIAHCVAISRRQFEYSYQEILPQASRICAQKQPSEIIKTLDDQKRDY
jgi:V/A-type H+-transporting ATPase subunit I